MGSKKYPKEDEYRRYIEHHAGQCNAFTSYMDTNYMFEISNDGLEGALEQMAKDCFKHPETGRPLTYGEMRMFYG